MILVTGAGGKLGSNIVAQLMSKIEKYEFIVTSSTQEGVFKLGKLGLNARFANFNDLDSLKEAFTDVSKIILISTMDTNRFEQHKNVIDVAKSLNVKTIIYTSLAIKNIENSSVKDLMISHFQTEEYLKNSGLNYNIVRNTMYAEALTEILGEKALLENIHLPGDDGKVPYVLRRELGEAIANLALNDFIFNTTYNLTGNYLVSYKDIAKNLTKLTKHKIYFDNISQTNYKNILLNKNLPEFAIYLHTGTVEDIKNKQYEIESSDLEKLLGRKSETPIDFLREIFHL